METDSYWTEFLSSERRGERSLSGRVVANVTIIGGGLTGLLTGYWLVRSYPGMRIVLLESAEIGHGPSGRNAGMVLPRPHADLEPIFGADAIRFTYDELAKAPQVIESLASREGVSCDLERAQFLSVALTEAQIGRLAKKAYAYRRFGMQCSMLDRDETRSVLGSARFRGSLEQHGAAVVNSGKFLEALYTALQNAGVQIAERTPALAIEHPGGFCVETARATIHTCWVVVATAAPIKCAHVPPSAFKMVEQQSFAILTEPVPEQLRELGWKRSQCVSDMRHVSNYARRCGERILFGGRMGFHGGACSTHTAGKVFERLAGELVQWFPTLRGAAITHRWRGVLDLSPLGIPVIEQHADGRLLRVSGYSGLGVAASIVCSRAVADAVLGREERWAKLVYRLAAEVPNRTPTSLRTLRQWLTAASGKLRDEVEDRWDTLSCRNRSTRDGA